MSKSASKLTIENPTRQAARVYLADKAYEVLAGREDAAKTGEILREIGIEDITLRMIRQTLSSSDRFEPMDRKWTVASRIQDQQKTFERIVESVISGYGRPMPFSVLTEEMTLTNDREEFYYEDMLPRVLGANPRFFSIDGDKYGLTTWLLVADADNAEDVLFDNFIEESEVAPYRKAAQKVQWNAADIVGSVVEFLKAVGHQVPMKTIAFFAWEGLQSAYKPERFYSAVALSDKIIIFSTQEALAAEQMPEVMKELRAIEAELEELPAELEEEVEAAPVTVSETDRDEIVAFVLKNGGSVPAEDILESVIEMSPGERGYEEAVASLREALKDEDRVIYVGFDRWRPAGTIPDFVNEVPDSLIIPVATPFETPEGDVFDQELEDEGLEAGLKQEMMNPLVEDIGDEDPAESSYQPMDSYQRAVLKYHHKETGTLPVVQFNPAFFGNDPSIIHITLVNEGVRRDVWINNETRLMYGLKDWYTPEMPVSGAVFELHKTERPGEFRFMYDSRTDPMVFVPTSRLFELLALKDESETQETPLFDIITRILEHYKKGIGFVPLFTEVNLVRRTARQLVASILSSYHCFHTRGKTGEWQYDQKKRSQGFNKAKRKYIKK